MCSTSRCSSTTAAGRWLRLAIAVEPEARGAGVGAALLEALARGAAASGHRELSLSVSPRSPAVRLYARAGFEVARDDAERVVMRRRLGPGYR